MLDEYGPDPDPAHPQVRIEVGNRNAYVDIEIADLVTAMWRADIDTLMSCQDNAGRLAGSPRRVWIHFADAHPAKRFLTVAAGEPSDDVDSLYERVLHKLDHENQKRFRRRQAWRYDLDVGDYNDFDELGTEIFIGLAVRFPFTDKAEVIRRLDAAAVPLAAAVPACQ